MDPPKFLPLEPDRGALRLVPGDALGHCSGLRLSGACLPEVSAWQLDVQVGVLSWVKMACAHVNEREEQETEP